MHAFAEWVATDQPVYQAGTPMQGAERYGGVLSVGATQTVVFGIRG